jgi:hypothetical protein
MDDDGYTLGLMLFLWIPLGLIVWMLLIAASGGGYQI